MMQGSTIDGDMIRLVCCGLACDARHNIAFDPSESNPRDGDSGAYTLALFLASAVGWRARYFSAARRRPNDYGVVCPRCVAFIDKQRRSERRRDQDGGETMTQATTDTRAKRKPRPKPRPRPGGGY